MATTLVAEPDKTILVGKTEIQEERVVVGRRDGPLGVRGRGYMIDGKAAVLQCGREIVGEPLIVLNEQEAHLPLPYFSS